MDSNKILNMSIGKLILVLILVGLMVTGGSYAYWMWTSNVNKNVVFNTISGLEDYIVYDEGESYFVGNFQPTDTFCQNVNNTISFKKTSEVSELIFLATIYMDINSIGDNISQSNDIYWVVTEGDNTINCEDGLNSESVLASGTFKNKKSGNTIELLDRIEVLETEKQYTVWMWIDSMGTDLSNLSGETIDANVWTEFMMTDTLEPEKMNPVESYSCANGSAGSEPYDITYTGDCEVIDDEDGNWRIKFLTSGIFKTDTDIEIDAFLVGGGGGGGISGATTAGGEGGGGGYTTTNTYDIKKDIEYEIIIGDGGKTEESGGTTFAFGYEALGGGGGSSRYGGTGGSGGGAGGNGGESGSDGGTNGSSAIGASGGGGGGQGTSTYEFGDSSLTLYSGGGGGGAGYNSSTYVYQSAGKGGAGGGGNGGKRGIGNSAAANTGGGGGGGSPENVSGGSGGSGIVVIRKTKSTCFSKYIPNNEFDFTYTGMCSVINDNNGNWRIKFLTSGIFKTDTDIEIDAFLVGGGGGGGISGVTTAGGEGGGGGYTTTNTYDIKKDIEYEIIIGEGGKTEESGGTTFAFGYEALGGGGGGVGSSRYGGSGGSGGGAGGNGSESGSAGGTNGSNALDSSGQGGSGQGTSTYEFGDSSLTLYSGGGGGGAGYNSSTYVYQSAGKGGAGGGGNGGKRGIGNSAAANTGGGGGGGSPENVSGGSGGSGIAVIRNKR